MEPAQLDLDVRARRFAALGDPGRLAIVDELALSDRAPVELRRTLGIESNLIAHHLDVLEAAGLIARSPSSGDGRRRYVRLVHNAFDGLLMRPRTGHTAALFVCSRNSARSQLAAALWTSMVGVAGESAGTHPDGRVHPGAVSAARRAGLDVSAALPRSLDEVDAPPPLVVTVCDQAHEELGARPGWLHWSIADPVAVGSRKAFDESVRDLRERITWLTRGTGSDA